MRGSPPESPRRLPREPWERRLRSLLSARSVAGQVFLLQLAVVGVLVVAAVVALVFQAQRQGKEAARSEVLAAGEAFANSPGIVEALDGPDPTAVLQPLIQKAQERSGLDTIVVSTP
ncbi:histidine kinase, partial [Streptomyces sp. NPDC006356]